jgi:ATP-binding cassette, subfamily B, bacterial
MHDGGWWSYIRYDEKQDRPQVSRSLMRRVYNYARPYLGRIVLMLAIIVVVTLLSLIPPLLIRQLIDVTLPQKNFHQLNMLALAMIAIPVVSGLLGVAQRYYGAAIGEGVIYDLRVSLYTHLQQMSLRFFTNTKTGELMSRLNNDVGGAQRAVSGTIVDLLTNLITLMSALVIMLRLEWRLTLLAVAVLPLFLIPARLLGRRVRAVVRQQMVYNSEMNAMMEETLNISGALLVKLFGRMPSEVSRFRDRAGRVRQTGIQQAYLMRWFFLIVSLVSAIGTALVFWAGGLLVLTTPSFSIGTIVAFTAYLGMLYGPLSSLSNTRLDFATSMVSFERVFEVLDLPVEIQAPPNALHPDRVAGKVTFEGVSFSYQPGENTPGASAVGLAEVVRFGGWGITNPRPPLSQERGERKTAAAKRAAGKTVEGSALPDGSAGNGHGAAASGALGADATASLSTSADVADAQGTATSVSPVPVVMPARADAEDEEQELLEEAEANAGVEVDEAGATPTVAGPRYALHDVAFEVQPGQLAALVGPSGAGKTTITYLLPRLYDPTHGTIRIDGHDVRDLTLDTLAAQIGMVTQETYLFNDTIRANLLYARQAASDAEIEVACRAANIHDFIVDLPDGYDTVVGNRGYRLSGGEKQRLAIARVILKDPRILVLDEATSSLDSQSEALIQQALERIMVGRTSLVIAHRLSTILAANVILVMDHGRLVEQGTHAELLACGGLYATLYETQFRHGRLEVASDEEREPEAA